MDDGGVAVGDGCVAVGDAWVAPRLVELVAPAVRDVLERYGAMEIVPVEAVVLAVARGLRRVPRVGYRRRLIDESGGAPVCWICCLPIPLGAAHDAPESFSIDHVVPRRDGGAALGYENLRAAHRLCNNLRDVPRRSRKWHVRKERLMEALRERCVRDREFVG